jgi:hypothetical protein
MFVSLLAPESSRWSLANLSSSRAGLKGEVGRGIFRKLGWRDLVVLLAERAVVLKEGEALLMRRLKVRSHVLWAWSSSRARDSLVVSIELGVFDARAQQETD